MFSLLKSPEEHYYDYLIRMTHKDKELILMNNPKFENQEEKLLSLYGSCRCLDKRLKVITIADTHGALQETDFRAFMDDHSDYDICVLLGDHSASDIKLVLSCVDRDSLYGLLGNHDGFNYLSYYNIQNLSSGIIEVNGVRIFGIGGSFRYKQDNNFPSYSQQECIEFLSKKGRADILFSHDCPLGTSDRGDAAHRGLFGITYYLYKEHVPVNIHGHLHMSYIKMLRNETKVKSCYMLESMIIDQGELKIL